MELTSPVATAKTRSRRTITRAVIETETESSKSEGSDAASDAENESNAENRGIKEVGNPISPFRKNFDWIQPSKLNGVPAILTLMQWMERHYETYKTCTQKDSQERMLKHLVGKLQTNRHKGCSMRAIRSKLALLRHQICDRMALPKDLLQFQPALQKIFEEEVG